MAQGYQQFSPLAAMSYVQQQGDIGRERGQRSQLNQLAAQSYSAPPEQRESLLSQMAGIDAGSAFQAEKQMAYSDERRDKAVSNAARLLTSAPEQYRPALYANMRNGLQKYIPNLPEQYDQSVSDAAASIMQALQGVNSTPTDVRSFQMMTEGLSPEDQMRARRVNLGLDGRASSAGFGFFEFEGADGRKRMGRNNPRTGAREMYDEASGDFVPLGGAQAGAAGTVNNPLSQGGSQAMVDQSAELANQLIAAGIPEAQVDAFLMQRLNPGGAQPMASRASPQLAVGRAPEDQAAATERAKLQAQLDALPAELGMRTNAAIAQTQGQEQVKQGVERAVLQATRARDAGTALELIAEARRLLPDATGGGLGAAADATAGFFGQSTAGAEANAALKTIAGQMTSKMPRMEGPQSDRDVQMYKDMAGDVGNANLPVRIRLAALSQIERLNQKYANRPSGGQQGPAAGAVEDGYRFKGGDPANPNSWERI